MYGALGEGSAWLSLEARPERCRAVQVADRMQNIKTAAPAAARKAAKKQTPAAEMAAMKPAVCREKHMEGLVDMQRATLGGGRRTHLQSA